MLTYIFGFELILAVSFGSGRKPCRSNGHVIYAWNDATYWSLHIQVLSYLAVNEVNASPLRHTVGGQASRFWG